MNGDVEFILIEANTKKKRRWNTRRSGSQLKWSGLRRGVFHLFLAFFFLFFVVVISFFLSSSGYLGRRRRNECLRQQKEQPSFRRGGRGGEAEGEGKEGIQDTPVNKIQVRWREL